MLGKHLQLSFYQVRLFFHHPLHHINTSTQISFDYKIFITCCKYTCTYKYLPSRCNVCAKHFNNGEIQNGWRLSYGHSHLLSFSEVTRAFSGLEQQSPSTEVPTTNCTPSWSRMPSIRVGIRSFRLCGLRLTTMKQKRSGEDHQVGIC